MKQFLKHSQQAWRISEMRLLFLALIVSVIAITSVGFFTDRVDKAMSSEATQLMGGDLVLSSSRPIDKKYLEHANTLGLKTAEMVGFVSMISSRDKMRLAQIKAISKNYPLTGEITVKETDSSSNATANMLHLKGKQVWAQPRLFIDLDITTNTSVQLGQLEFQLNKMITKMPSQGITAFQLAPQVLMPLDQLADTGLLTPASRAKFTQFYAGDLSTITQFKDWLNPQLKVTEKITTLDDSLTSIKQALDRAKRFLGLAALLSVILAGAAIALTSYSLNQRETRTVAVLKTLGASQRNILYRYLIQLLFIASLAAILGSVIGYALQGSVIYFLQDYLNQSLPRAGGFPIFTGIFTAYIMVLGFSAPQLFALTKTAPVQIFQKQKGKSTAPYRYAIFAILSGIFLLMWLQTHDVKLSLFLLIGTIIATLIFWLIANILLRQLSKVSRSIKRSSSINFPKANQRIVLLIVVFGIGLFSLLLLTTLRIDIIDRWQATLPDDAPNHYLTNIQPEERASIEKYLRDNKITSPVYPMIRGRLTSINKKKIKLDDYSNERAKRLLAREFNMSSMNELPNNNSIISGEWFNTEAAEGFSVEEGLAETLNLKIGDFLRFDIAGSKYQSKITSIRSVRWDSMQPNFFVLAAPNSIEKQPKTYITSIHIDDNNQRFIPELIKQYPSITDFDIGSIIEQVKSIINKAAFAVQAIFSFTLIAGIIVLFAALQSQKAERRKEIAILKSIGASRSYLRKSLITEFTLVGAISGLIAGILAVIAGNISAYWLFDLAPSINILLVITGMFVGAVLVGIAGYLNIRPLLKITPTALFQI